MAFDAFKHHRRSIRLKGYDYSQAGAYYVTIVARNHVCLFGQVFNAEMRLNDAGQMIQSQWGALPRRFPNVELDEYVVMPNHMHGIILIGDGADGGVGAIHESPLRIQRRKMLLPKIIGYFKMNTAKHINGMRDTQGAPVWQRNYYEHIVRNEQDLARIREYIVNNPARWEIDQENPTKLNKAK
jgi:putative transposase